MSEIASILVQIVLLIGIGLVVRWTEVLPRDATVAIFNGAVMNLTLPATVFLGLMSIPGWSADLAKIVLIAFMVVGASALLARQLAKVLRLRRATAGAMIITSMCGSTGFFGTPLFGELAHRDPAHFGQAVGLASLYSELGTLVPLLTLSVIIAAFYGEGQRWSPRQSAIGLFRSLPFVALVLGILFWPETHNSHFPAYIVGTLGYLRSATVALTMIALGMTITIRDFSQYLRSIFSVNAIKLLFAPALGLVLSGIFRLHPEAHFVVVVESALPAVVLAITYANQYKLDVEFASTAVFATFFFGFLTIPFWAYLAQMTG